MAHNALTRHFIRGAVAVVVATVFIVAGGAIVFWMLHPYGMRVTGYTPVPSSQMVRHHG